MSQGSPGGHRRRERNVEDVVCTLTLRRPSVTGLQDGKGVPLQSF